MMTYINFPRRIASFQEALRREGVDVLVQCGDPVMIDLHGIGHEWYPCAGSP